MTTLNKKPVVNIQTLKLNNIINQNDANKPLYQLKYLYSDSLQDDLIIFINWTPVKISKKSIFNKTFKLKLLDEKIKNIIDSITRYLNLEDSGLNIIFQEGLSTIELHPSKKSGLDIYKIKKIDNLSQIDKYFPFHYKKNSNIKILGKLIIKVSIFKNPDNHSYLSMKIIHSELKYDHSTAIDEGIKLESIYNKNVYIEV
jgi:hypothetical protein